MLADLAAYYDQLSQDGSGKVEPIGWSAVRISHVAMINVDGELESLLPVDVEESMCVVPEQVKRASGVAANFLCDRAAYILGLDQGEQRLARAEKCFEAAAALHRRILTDVDSPCAEALLNYFGHAHPSINHPAVVNAGDSVLAGGNIAFRVSTYKGLCDPLKDRAIRDAWETHFIGSGNDLSVARCLVTGELSPVARLHPSIDGVHGANSSGASLVSFNASAFESYGHDGEQGRNAPVGVRSARAYAAALNYLLRNPKHHVTLGDVTVVYWSDRSDVVNSQVLWAATNGRASDTESDDSAETFVDGTMKAIAEGRYRDIDGVDLDATFHILGLAPSVARLAVKFYLKDSFGSVLDNISEHYRISDVAHAPTAHAQLTPHQVLNGVENPNAKKKATVSRLSESLLKSILMGAPYSRVLYLSALSRIRATQNPYKVTRAHASIIRAYLIRNCTKNGYDEENLTMSLNEERNERAYCLGRAFAILEQIQEAANGKATITNRYFNAASTTPLAAFPSIVRLSGAHLTKIERTKPGLAVWFRRQLLNVLGEERVRVFPKRLSLAEQGDFILGYYHQMAKRYESKVEQDKGSVDNEEVQS